MTNPIVFSNEDHRWQYTNVCAIVAATAPPAPQVIGFATNRTVYTPQPTPTHGSLHPAPPNTNLNHLSSPGRRSRIMLGLARASVVAGRRALVGVGDTRPALCAVSNSTVAVRKGGGGGGLRRPGLADGRAGGSRHGSSAPSVRCVDLNIVGWKKWLTKEMI